MRELRGITLTLAIEKLKKEHPYLFIPEVRRRPEDWRHCRNYYLTQFEKCERALMVLKGKGRI
jgi:hypothetical protein